MCEIVCPYTNKCTQHPTLCSTCIRNTGKRNYYKPEPIPLYPYPYPYYEPIWVSTTTDDGSSNYDTTWIMAT